MEASSGNTGIGLAIMSIIHGYKQIITIPDKMSGDKINKLKAMGCEVHICPTELEHDHCESYTGLANEISKTGVFYPD